MKSIRGIRRIVGATCTLFFIFCPIRLSSQEVLRLDSCVRWAAENYPLVEQLQLMDRSRDYNIKNINTGYILRANITGFGGYMEGLPDLSSMGMDLDPYRLAGIVQIEQPIWDGGRLQNQKKIAREETEVNKSAVEIKMAELKDKVSEIYFGILLAQTQREQLQAQTETLSQSLKTLKSAAEAGSAFASDADAVEVKLLQIEQQGVQLRSSERAYRRMLSIFIGRTVGENTKLEVPTVVLHSESDFSMRPEMALFEHRKALLDAYNPGAGEVLPRLSLQGMGLMVWPQIKMPDSRDPLSGNVVKEGQQWNHIFMGGLNFSWPIGGRTYTMLYDKKRLKVEKDIVEREKESFEMGQQITLSRQSEMLSQWNDLIAYDDRIIELLSNRTHTLFSRYKNGVVPITEWLQALSDENSARQNKAMHEIEKMKTRYQYNRTLGY